VASNRSHLSNYLAAVYALLIVFASLEPFTGWTAPASPHFFLWSPVPRVNLSDLLINIVAYTPLGFFTALRYRPPTTSGRAMLAATAICCVLSFAMESLQSLLPSRVASTADLISNTGGGALGALPALLLLQHPEWRRRITGWRERVFMGGRPGDVGLALLALWLLVQSNPAIPLFGLTYAVQRNPSSAPADTLLEGAQSLFNVVGVGLFVTLLLRRRQHIGTALLTLLASSAVVKAAAAWVLLKPNFWERWLEPGSARGLAIGCLILLALVWLPRRVQSVLCSVSLLSALGINVIAPDLVITGTPLSLFSWSYGQLLNFNGLTRTALLLWPVLATAYLFALAGRSSETLVKEAARPPV
jgi:VanZ family protein